MGDLERVLPNEIVNRSRRAGAEFVLSKDDANQAVSIAANSQIAVLGVEVFRILSDGLLTENYTGYEFALEADWSGFVRLNNDAALAFLAAQPGRAGHGFILTSTSEDEFRHLRDPLA